MCLICVELIKQRMTLKEAENAATELVVVEGSALQLREKGELEHTIALLESIQDLDLVRLEQVLEQGTQDAAV